MHGERQRGRSLPHGADRFRAPHRRGQPRLRPGRPDQLSEAPETREWLVDGFNVLHASLPAQGERSEWWTAPHRERLIGLARSFPDPAARIWIVFDGPRPAPTADAAAERVQVVFADSADEWIVKRVRGSEDPAHLAVVTGDRQVAGRARHRGAQVTSPREFLARCLARRSAPAERV